MNSLHGLVEGQAFDPVGSPLESSVTAFGVLDPTARYKLLISGAGQGGGGGVREIAVGPRAELEFVGAVVDTLMPGSPAEEGGLHLRDIIQEVNGKPLGQDFGFIAKAVAQSGEQPIVFSVLRDGGKTDLTVTPRISTETGRYVCGFLYSQNLFVQKDTKGGRKLLERLSGNYQTVEGETICTYFIDVERSEVEHKRENKTFRGKPVDAITLQRGEKTINLIDRFNTPRIPILLSNSGAGGFHDMIGNQIVISEIERPNYIHILLHELTHADQFLDPKWKKYFETYHLSNFVSDHQKLWEYGLRSLLNVLKQRIPELLKDIDMETAVEVAEKIIAETEDCVKDLQACQRDAVALTSMPPDDVTKLNEEMEALTRRYEEGLRSIDDAYQRVASIELRPGVGLLDLLSYPRWLVERDAERGALMKLRSLRKETGIDFLRPLSKLTRQERESLELANDTEFLNTQPPMTRKNLEAEIAAIRKLLEDGEEIVIVKEIRGYMNRIEATPRAVRRMKAAGITFRA